MAIPRLTHRVWRLLSSSQVYDASIAICAGVTAAVTSYRFAAEGWPTAGLVAGASAYAVCALSVARAAVGYRQQARKDSLHDLRGCLMTLHAVLARSHDRPRQAGLRLTIHAAVSERHLQQVLEYVGDSRGGRSVGRVFAMQSGVIGRAYRTRRPCGIRRLGSEYESYVRGLVRKWSYVETDARRLNPATMACMAVPLLEPGGEIVGVLYLDAREGTFFTPRRRRVIEGAASGIATFTAERYPDSGRSTP